MNIAIAASEIEIERCFPVMAQLRTHLDRTQFTRQVKNQQQQGYQLAYLEDGGEVRSLGGFRFMETLAFGKILYVDDLVTADSLRSRGYGGRLFDWLVAQARSQQCAQLHLDSGVHRFAAHRFYLAKRMQISCHHFSLSLDKAS
ncbi:MAG: GNAT family N-acetyltransferase [Acidiferrobacterales bacterium]